MEIKGSTVLVTGANRGIGRSFVEAFHRAGAARIYAAARNVGAVADLVSREPERIFPVLLDITDSSLVRGAAKWCGDVNVLVNNAGISHMSSLIGVENLDAAREEMAVNYFGTLAMVRAFASILAANGGGAILNVLTLGGLVSFPLAGSYCASKAASHLMTQSIRAELASQGTLVTGIYPGAVDTDMAAHTTVPKEPPSVVVEAGLKAIAEGIEDVFPGKAAAEVWAGLLTDPKRVEKQRAQIFPSK